MAKANALIWCDPLALVIRTAMMQCSRGASQRFGGNGFLT